MGGRLIVGFGEIALHPTMVAMTTTRDLRSYWFARCCWARILAQPTFGNIEIFKNPDFSVVVTNNSYMKTIFLKNCLCSDNFLVIEVVASFEGYLIDFCVIEVELPDV